MLIVNDAHLCLAGRLSLEERCHYGKKPLAAYPLVPQALEENPQGR